MKKSSRKLEKHSYADDFDLEDEEIGCNRLWHLDEKLASQCYNADFAMILDDGQNFSLRTFQEDGFQTPIYFTAKTGLGIRIPGDSFTVNDVKTCVGSNRLVDVMDVNTQKALVMKMRDWCLYYNNLDRERLLNVISLEFSHTKLDNYVESPTVVRQIDWLDRAWPLYLKEMQIDPTNNMFLMKYPKVRKYVLMSVAGCYTDWHIDFGGTSVWYHILTGEKIFWLIRPTERNISLFERWCLSGQQGDCFFGDVVGQGECQKFHLKVGSTFLIPTGWIHAVYTPKDSLVFGGNFLHSFNAALQLRIWQVEDTTHVKMKFRYPYYTELHWYVLARYVSCLLGKNYVVPLEDGRNPLQDPQDALTTEFSERQLQRENGEETAAPLFEAVDDEGSASVNTEDVTVKDEKWQHLSSWEHSALRIILRFLKTRPPSKTYIPADIPDPDGLQLRVEEILLKHKADDQNLCLSGNPILKWDVDHIKEAEKLAERAQKMKWGRQGSGARSKSSMKSKQKLWDESGPQRRRIRCRMCEPCRRDECRDCGYCHDMKKYGGTGTMKQCCVQKQCISPRLPSSANCFFCLDNSLATDEEREADDYDMMSDIFECGICWKIVHPKCLYAAILEKNKREDDTPNPEATEVLSDGFVLEDLSNYWECATCINEGKRGFSKPRIPKGIMMIRKLEQMQADGPTNTVTDAPTTVCRPKREGSVGRGRGRGRGLSSTRGSTQDRESVISFEDVSTDVRAPSRMVEPLLTTLANRISAGQYAVEEITVGEDDESDSDPPLKAESPVPLEESCNNHDHLVKNNNAEVSVLPTASPSNNKRGRATTAAAMPSPALKRVYSASSFNDESIFVNGAKDDEVEEEIKFSAQDQAKVIGPHISKNLSSLLHPENTNENVIIRSRRREISRPKRFEEDGGDHLENIL